MYQFFSRWCIWGFGLSRREEKHSRNVAGTRCGKATARGRASVAREEGRQRQFPGSPGHPGGLLQNVMFCNSDVLHGRKEVVFVTFAIRKNKSTRVFLAAFATTLQKKKKPQNKQLVKPTKPTKPTSATAGDGFRVTNLLSTRSPGETSKHNQHIHFSKDRLLQAEFLSTRVLPTKTS